MELIVLVKWPPALVLIFRATLSQLLYGATVFLLPTPPACYTPCSFPEPVASWQCDGPRQACHLCILSSPSGSGSPAVSTEKPLLVNY